MADKNFRALGNFLGGGNHPNEIVAEAQGEQLGANTQAAIAKAQETQQKTQARAANAGLAAALPGSSPALGAYLGNAAMSEFDPRQGIESIGLNQKNAAGQTIVDPNSSDTSVARALLLRDANAPGLEQQLGEGQVGNKLHPGSSLATPVSGSVVAKNTAEAALKNEEAAHPEKFHFPPLGSQPTDPETDRMATELINRGWLDTPTRFNMTPQAIHLRYNALMANDAGGGGNVGGAAGKNLLAVEKSFSSNKPSDAGGKLAAGNKLTAHMGLMRQAADAAGAQDLPALQHIQSLLGFQAGSDIPTSLDLISHFVGNEMDSYLAANNPTLAGREQAQQQFQATGLGAGQLKKNADTGEALMGGQMASLKKEYSSPYGRTPAETKNFSKRYLLRPELLDAYEKEHGEIMPGVGIAGAGPIPAAAPAAPAVSAGAPPPGWVLHQDAAGNKAYVSPDGKQFQEVK